jgi:hypothetical protein
MSTLHLRRKQFSEEDLQIKELRRVLAGTAKLFDDFPACT